MREQKSNMLGDIVRMEAVNAGQNIGKTNYIDQDDFYPATGISVDEQGDIDTIDMVYDHDLNDLSASADFFDGDSMNVYADGEDDYEDEEDFDGDDDYEDFDDEDEEDFDGDYDDEDDYEDFDDEEEDDFDGEDDYEDFDDEDDYEDFDDEDDDYDSYDGIDPADTEAEWGEFEGEDDIDMDESMGDYNDLPSGSFDFFDGGDPELDVDYNNFDADTYSEVRGRRRRRVSPRRAARQERRADRRDRRETRQDERKDKREARQAERKEKRETRQDERKERRLGRKAQRKERREGKQELRAKKKLAKIGEIEARNEATKALAQPQQDVLAQQVVADMTKKSNELPKKEGLGTGAIVGISLGALALVGGVIYLILRKK